MKRHEVLKALDNIDEMTDEEIAMNAEYIRKVAKFSYCLIKQKYPSKQNQQNKK